MTLFKITLAFVAAAILSLSLLLAECHGDCYYGCSDTNQPDDGITYWLSRDGDYIPIPSPPPAVVVGPPVYFRNGYPIPVDPYPPERYHNNRRRGMSNEDIRAHERAVEQYHYNRRQW